MSKPIWYSSFFQNCYFNTVHFGRNFLIATFFDWRKRKAIRVFQLILRWEIDLFGQVLLSFFPFGVIVVAPVSLQGCDLFCQKAAPPTWKLKWVSFSQILSQNEEISIVSILRVAVVWGDCIAQRTFNPQKISWWLHGSTRLLLSFSYNFMHNFSYMKICRLMFFK